MDNIGRLLCVLHKVLKSRAGIAILGGHRPQWQNDQAFANNRRGAVSQLLGWNAEKNNGVVDVD
jgi:hypothetical protein